MLLQMILVAIAILVALSYIFASVAADGEEHSDPAMETASADAPAPTVTPHAA